LGAVKGVKTGHFHDKQKEKKSSYKLLCYG